MSAKQVPDGYRAVYRHHVAGHKYVHKTKRVEPRQVAVCLLFRDGSDVPCARGYAYLRPGDHYNRAIARAITLGRALRCLEGRERTQHAFDYPAPSRWFGNFASAGAS